MADRPAYEAKVQVDAKKSYASTTCNYPIISRTIGDFLDESAEKYPDRVAFIYHKENGLQMTLGSLKEKALKLAKNLLHLGLKKGDRVGIILPQTHELHVTYIACAYAGVVAVPFDPIFGTATLEFMLADIQPAALFCFDLEKYSELRSFTEEFLAKLPELKTLTELKNVIVLGDADSKVSFEGARTLSFHEVANTTLSADDLPLPYVDPDDAAFIIYSSGTTALPKGIVLRHGAMTNTLHLAECSTAAITENPQLTRRLHICTDLKWYRIGAINGMVQSLIAGQVVTVYPKIGYEQGMGLVYEALQEYKCDGFMSSPKTFDTLLQDPLRHNYDLSSVKFALSGTQAAPAELLDRVRKELKLHIMFNSYGATEMCGGTHLTRVWDDDERRMKTVGQPAPYLECKIVNTQTGEIVPHDTDGELLVRSPFVFKTYWNSAEKTRKALDENGWYHTDDVFRMDKDGYFFYSNRIKDILFHRNAERKEIFPSQIEEELRKHANVHEAVIFGIPITAYAHYICAWVILKDSTVATTQEELQAFLKDRLAFYKVPEFIKFVTELPVSESNKYLRREMSVQYKDELKL